MSETTDFKVGDVVMLRSGGPWMTVSSFQHGVFRTDVALLKWHDKDNHEQSGLFNPAVLRKVTLPQDKEHPSPDFTADVDAAIRESLAEMEPVSDFDPVITEKVGGFLPADDAAIIREAACGLAIDGYFDWPHALEAMKGGKWVRRRSWLARNLALGLAAGPVTLMGGFQPTLTYRNSHGWNFGAPNLAAEDFEAADWEMAS